MTRKLSTTVAACATLALTGLAAGCGSDDDDASGGGSASTPKAAETTSANAAKGAPILIGNIGGYTGTLGKTLGKGKDVLQAWVDDRNANGGINGHPIKVFIKDDAANPATALKGVKELIDDNKVVAIVSDFSFQESAWQKYADKKKIPVIGGASTNPAFLTDPNFFASGTTLVPMLYGVLEMTKNAGKKKLGVMYCAETPVCAQLLPLLQGLGKVAGVEVTGQKIASNAPNYTAPCLALRSAGADAMWIAVASDLVPRITESCHKQGYKPQNVASNSTVDAAFLEKSSMDGTIFSGSNALYTQDDVPGVQRFNKLVDEKLPGLRDSDQFSLPLIFSFAGAELFAKAAEAAKLTPQSTSADLLKGLYALKDETLDGVSPPLNFVKGTPGATLCYFPQKIEDGKFVAANDGSPVCPSPETAKAIGAALAG